MTLEPIPISARSQINMLVKIQANIWEKEFTCNYVGLLDPEIQSVPGLFTFTFSHLADAFIQSDLIGEYIKRLILKRQTYRGSANNTKSQALFK